MIQKTQKTQPTINLDGPQGNAYAVMGFVQNIMKQLKKDFKPIQTEMMSGDYINLIQVGYRETQHVTIWETDSDEYLDALEEIEKLTNN